MSSTTIPMNSTEELFARLDAMIEQAWAEAAQQPLWVHVLNEQFDAPLYRDLMVQIFHYTRWNSLNQALAVASATPEQRPLLRFVYRHADEELGHEQMVVHDLRSVGLIEDDDDLRDFPKLPATDALINYLSGVAYTEGPIARLGYSYWAEDVYPHIAPLLGAAAASLGLGERQMTFFVAHSDIDEAHSVEVRRIIDKAALTPDDRAAVLRVATTTLWLTIELMNQAYDGFVRGESNDSQPVAIAV